MKHGDDTGDENEVYRYHSFTTIFHHHYTAQYFSLEKEVPESLAWGTGRIQVKFKPNSFDQLHLKIDKDDWNKLKI